MATTYKATQENFYREFKENFNYYNGDFKIFVYYKNFNYYFYMESGNYEFDGEEKYTSLKLTYGYNYNSKSKKKVIELLKDLILEIN